VTAVTEYFCYLAYPEPELLVKNCFHNNASHGLASRTGCVLLMFAGLAVQPDVVGISPPTGPEGARVEIIGKNLQSVSAVFFGKNPAVFKPVSAERLIAIVPHRASTSTITVVTPQGQRSSRLAFVVSNNPRIPDEVSYKAGYVNPSPRPADFGSARMWGIAIADTRVPGHESAQVEGVDPAVVPGRRQRGCSQ
jgi:hypothetical protein